MARQSIFDMKVSKIYPLLLQKGIAFVRGLHSGVTEDTGSRQENLSRLRNEIENADAIVIGAGAGLSELQRGGLSGAD